MKLDIDTVIEAVKQDDNLGFCVGCGCEHTHIEPDARQYKCDACGEHKVYGAEEILLTLS